MICAFCDNEKCEYYNKKNGFCKWVEKTKPHPHAGDVCPKGIIPTKVKARRSQDAFGRDIAPWE